MDICNKNIIKIEKTQQDISKAIIKDCLFSQIKSCGAYQVDDSKVWDCIVLKDTNCKKELTKLNINDIYGVYSYDDEVCYKQMRGTYPKKRRKTGA